jgi:hypothetical protein
MSDNTSCLPLLEAIDLVEARLGQDGWTWIKRHQQAGKLPMCGFANGEKKLFQPHWLDYTDQWNISEPQPLNTTASQIDAWEGEGLPSEPRDFSIPSVGSGQTSDRPRRTALPDKFIDGLRNLPHPIPTGPPTNDDMLYFDVSKARRRHGIKVPQRVTRIQVDAEKLHALIAEQTQPVQAPKPGPKPGALRRYIERDRTLYPEIHALMKKCFSLTAATERLADEGKVAGGGASHNKARRLAREFKKDAGVDPTRSDSIPLNP